MLYEVVPPHTVPPRTVCAELLQLLLQPGAELSRVSFFVLVQYCSCCQPLPVLQFALPHGRSCSLRLCGPRNDGFENDGRAGALQRCACMWEPQAYGPTSRWDVLFHAFLGMGRLQIG